MNMETFQHVEMASKIDCLVDSVSCTALCSTGLKSFNDMNVTVDSSSLHHSGCSTAIRTADPRVESEKREIASLGCKRERVKRLVLEIVRFHGRNQLSLACRDLIRVEHTLHRRFPSMFSDDPAVRPRKAFATEHLYANLTNGAERVIRPGTRAIQFIIPRSPSVTNIRIDSHSRAGVKSRTSVFSTCSYSH